MLTNAQRDLIKATVPLLESGGEALTTHFYRMMLSEYPEVRPLFNQAHQASGDQPRALANGVLMYARHIDRLEALGPLVRQVVNKHVALQILPEHYPIVGSCLLRAIREVLGVEIATDAVIDACRKRARPVLMTSIAMTAGMLPIAFGFGADAAFRQPMAVAVIGGLITSTLLSLIVIPAAFAAMETFTRRFTRKAVA